MEVADLGSPAFLRSSKSLAAPPCELRLIYRRQFLATSGICLIPLAVRGQQEQKVFRVALLSQRDRTNDFWLLSEALYYLGYEEGRNIAFEHWSTQGHISRIFSLATDMVAGRPDLILTTSNTETLIAKHATSTIPIVVSYGFAPVQSDLVASLDRPGGNVTGVTVYEPETAARKVELLRELLPRLLQVTLLWDPRYPGMESYRRGVARAAAAMGVRMIEMPVRSTKDLDSAFDAILRSRPGALFIVTIGAVFDGWQQVTRFAAKAQLPAIYTDRTPVIHGAGLMSHSEDIDTVAHQLAAIIDRIFKGEKPADLRMAHAGRYVTTVNLKGASAIGITLPPALVAKADEVIL